MGASQSVHMANASGQNISVFVGLNPRWALLDFFVDITLMLFGANEIRNITLSSADFKNYKVPTKLETLQDLFEYTTVAGIMITTGANVPSISSAAQGFFDSIRRTAISIPNGTFKNINEKNVLQIYLNPSGYAGLMGAKTVTIFVMSADGKQVALYNTGPDHSWIATAEQTIVRSRYGSIWQQDPSAGSHAWPRAFSTIRLPEPGFQGIRTLPMEIERLSAVDGVVYATEGAAEGAVGSDVDVAKGAAGGVDGEVDEVDDLADAADGKAATENALDEVDADGVMPVDDGAHGAAPGV